MSNEYKDWNYDTEYEEVYNFVNEIHKNQLRKDNKTPYITHLVSVANIVSDWMTNSVIYNLFDKSEIHNLKLVSLLHDSVEDTDTSLYEIESKYGKFIKDGVYWLTKKSTLEDGKRDVRVLIDINHILQAPLPFLIIKLADIYDNCKDIIKVDRNFAPVYLNEKKQLLDMITHNLIEGKYDKEGKWLKLLYYAHNYCRAVIIDNLDKLDRLEKIKQQ